MDVVEAPPARSGSTTGRTQPQRRALAKGNLLRAATEIVAEQGLERLTLADLGLRAGYSRGLPAKYFVNKAGLVDALVDRMFPRLNPTLNVGLAPLLATIRGNFREAGDVKMRCRLTIIASAFTHPDIQARVRAENADLAARIERHIVAGIAAGEISDSIDVKSQAILILAGMRAAIAQWLLDPSGAEIGVLCDEFVRALHAGLMSTPAITSAH